MMVIVAEHSGLEYPSRDGFYPFKGTPGNFDPTKIEPGYFDFVDWVVEEAASMDITIALVPTWGRYSESRPPGSAREALRRWRRSSLEPFWRIQKTL
jgi:hypothetical protein